MVVVRSITRVVEITMASASSAAAAAAAASTTTVVALLSLVNSVSNDPEDVTPGFPCTYNGVNLVFDRTLRPFDGVAATHKLNLTLALTRSWLLGDVDLASCSILHLSDGLSTFSDDHANGFVGNVNCILNLVLGIVSRIVSAWWGSVVAISVSTVTVDDLHDKILGLCSSGVWADQVDGPQPIHALRFAHDIDMATAPFLQVPDGLATASNDETDSAVRHHNLQTIFAIFQVGYTTAVDRNSSNSSSSSRRRRGGASASTVKTSASDGTHAAVLDDAVDGSLGFGPPGTWPCDLALSELFVAIAWGEKLDTTLGLAFDTPQILTLSANDQTDEASFNLHCL